ncbi:MAG: BrnT family toxin [Pyrinomonadaceae bacterium]
MRFEWDPIKAVANFRKHGVSFDETETAFVDPRAAVFLDKDHSIEEKREIIIAYSNRSRLLVISFTERKGDVIRIISVRRDDPEERRNHEI